MPFIQIGCSAEDLEQAQWEVWRDLRHTLQHGEYAREGQQWLWERLQALPTTAASPRAWLEACVSYLAHEITQLLALYRGIDPEEVHQLRQRYDELLMRCRKCPAKEAQDRLNALHQCGEQAQRNVERLQAALAAERRAHTETHEWLEAQVSAQNALIVELREELKART
jgi:septum formation topological specificity factor MinE